MLNDDINQNSFPYVNFSGKLEFLESKTPKLQDNSMSPLNGTLVNPMDFS